jgi:hypothetical protein
MDFTFELEGESGRRQAHRERVRGLAARIEGHEADFTVHDVSVSGLALVDSERRLRQGAACRVSLLIAGRLLIAGLSAQVVREVGPERELAGVAFGALSARQEAWLDKLVLEIQKRRIDLRKARAVADNLEDKKKTDRAETET